MKKNSIGWIGTGVMGNSMCIRLLNAGYSLHIYNRTKEKAHKLIKMGAIWCDTPKEVAIKTNIVFTIVGYPNDVKSVILGKNGVLEGIKSESIIVDMTTSEPELADIIYSEAQKKGVSSIDAPVSGGDIGAKEGTLAIMCGGDKKTFDQMYPIFEIMGGNIAYMGKAGAGQHTKMSNQILIASTMIGVIESLIYAYKAGLNLDSVIDVIGKGAASSWSINNLGRRIVNDNYDPGFFIKHFIKDMGIALKESKKMNISLPGLALANQFYIAATAMGYENMGTQGLYKVFQKLNNIR
jgi:3-hydroxyisobutyrate dehydrogenase